ncbi:MAG: transglutaminase-like domain-containing protein, partial [Termitinemataceae bacterium]
MFLNNQSFRKRWMPWIRLMVAQIMGSMPPVLLSMYLRGRGPLVVLVVWTFCVILGFWLAREELCTAVYRSLLRIMSMVLFGAGILIIAVLLNVSRRSLAEAWFEMVRNGTIHATGGGFFTFFAAMIYGALCVGCALLVLYSKFFAAVVAFGSLSLLLRGVLYEDTTTFVLAGVGILLLCFLLLQSRSPSIRRRKGAVSLMRSFLVPTLATLLAGLPLLYLFIANGVPFSLSQIDLTPLVLRIAPSLPLLLEVPGYGLEIPVSRFSPRLELASVPLFAVEGPREFNLYLISRIYGDRTDKGWIEDPLRSMILQQPLELTPDTMETEAPEATIDSMYALQLRFVGDLYDRLPLPAGAVQVQLSDEPIPMLSHGLIHSIRFDVPFGAGLTADIQFTDQAPTEGTNLNRYRNPGPDKSGRIKELSGRWVSLQDPYEQAAAVQKYLVTQYRYSERTAAGPTDEALERFLFEDERGYCLHFASAFVVLLRHLGIPA